MADSLQLIIIVLSSLLRVSPKPIGVQAFSQPRACAVEDDPQVVWSDGKYFADLFVVDPIDLPQGECPPVNLRKPGNARLKGLPEIPAFDELFRGVPPLLQGALPVARSIEILRVIFLFPRGNVRGSNLDDVLSEMVDDLVFQDPNEPGSQRRVRPGP